MELEPPVACRIIILAKTKALGHEVVHRIRTYTATSARVQDQIGEDSSSNALQKNTDPVVKIVPWTIQNKYYTADVHFKVIPLDDWVHSHLEGVPAVVFAFSVDDEAFKGHILKLSAEIEQYDPEITLALATSSPNSTQDLDEMEDFFSESRFELIDCGHIVKAEADHVDGSDFPGIGRAVDALSTVMWPSMVQSSMTTSRKSRARQLFEFVNQVANEDSMDDDDLRGLIANVNVDVENGGEIITEAKARLIREEVVELERWLDESDSPSQTPPGQDLEDSEAWKMRINTSVPNPSSPGLVTPTFTLSPSTSEVPQGHASGLSASEAPLGFEDDFSEYVSALAPLKPLEPMHTGASYASLHSMMEDEDLSDPELPNQVEIQETTRRIFGSVGTSSSSALPSTSLHPPTSSSSISNQQPAGRSTDVSSLLLAAGLGSDSSSFDLSRVFGALQEMKTEIAGIEDESERRKAAATVALGLVYGLDMDDSSIADDDDLGI